MFPKWSDWQIQYTTKGLIKRRICRTMKLLALAALIVGAYYLRKDFQGGLKSLRTVIVQSTRLGLLRGLQVIQEATNHLTE